MDGSVFRRHPAFGISPYLHLNHISRSHRPIRLCPSPPTSFHGAPLRARIQRAGHGRRTLNMVFTGIVEEMGTVKSIENVDAAEGGVAITVCAKTAQEGSKIGDSISINGTCLSITSMTGESLTFGLVPETLQRTNLGKLQPGQRVNLERSLSANARFGGHIVQGHVDCTGTITEKRQEKDALWFTIRIPRKFMKYVVEKGYIAVDGTSLTVCDVFDDAFTFTMIPITQDSVVTAAKNVGDEVNIECDITGKYIERMVMHRSAVQAAA